MRSTSGICTSSQSRAKKCISQRSTSSSSFVSVTDNPWLWLVVRRLAGVGHRVVCDAVLIGVPHVAAGREDRPVGIRRVAVGEGDVRRYLMVGVPGVVVRVQAGL